MKKDKKVKQQKSEKQPLVKEPQQAETPVEKPAEKGERPGELVSRETELNRREEAVVQREEVLNQREQAVSARELEAKNNFPSLLREKFQQHEKQLQERESELDRRLAQLEKQAEKLRLREQKVKEAEIVREEGYTELRQKLDQELSQKRQSVHEELASLRHKKLQELDKQLEQERTQRLASISQEAAAERKRIEAEIKERKQEFERAHQEADKLINQSKQELAAQRQELEDQRDSLAYEQMRLASREKRMDERLQNIDEEVEQKVAERFKSFETEEARLKRECERLRESLRISEETFGLFEELKRKLGHDDPERVLLRLNTQEEELKRLRAELLERPTTEMRLNYDAMLAANLELKARCERLQDEINGLQQKLQKQNQFEHKIALLEGENKSLLSQKDSLDCECNRLQGELKRLHSPYQREQDKEQRIKDIETPYFTDNLIRSSEEITEIDWLQRIEADCLDYGLKFPKRILYAFHTALKTAEWSPLTVLSGVSGTGKSELPRLYSHFGGLKFLNLAVQPNWDSQESMLGFFNSIDNKFDAQPVLRLLAQSQKKLCNDYPGLEDVMTMVLLDEMNLAYVELYFAEFLSKLELRRGRKGHEVPALEVKLGAGIVDPYKLPLGRNVLWAGTMNQDETTKSLSDKVLDRGIVINFPRPTTFERRLKLKPLTDPAPLLSRKLWESWWNRESKFTPEQIMPFKSFVEELNKSLSNAGRALGHRVWQSVEYYMANYPEVLLAQRNMDEGALVKAMRIAFEDQLVQKVMPKLRGIETRGRGKSECLDKIRHQLINHDYAIVEDFDLACEFGYGQFMWHSANYLKEEEAEIFEDEVKAEAAQGARQLFLNAGLEAEQAHKLAEAGFQSYQDILDAKLDEFKGAGIIAIETLEIKKKVKQYYG